MTPRNRGVSIRYWHGFCSTADLNEQDKEHLTRLLLGEYQTLKLEKLNNTSIYSIRVSDERRILFTTITQAGMQIALVLEVLPTHDYKNAKSLNNKLALPNHDIILNENNFISIDSIEGLAPQITDKETTDLIECDYYNGQFIVLTDEQKQAKDALKMPLIISGIAGSGKTSTMLSVLIDIVEDYHRNHITPEHPVLFVSEKASLIAERRTEWQNHPLSHTPAGQRVQFMTDGDVCDTHFPIEVRQQQRISTEDLIQRIMKCIEKQSQGKFNTKNREIQLLHEFEIIAGSDSEEEYIQKLGAHESNVAKDERALFYAAAQTLMSELKEDKCYSPRLYRFDPTPCFDTVLADEAQGGSRVFKRNLRAMAANGRFIACVDTLQTTDKPISDVPYLVNKLGINGSPATLHHLTLPFRNPLRVIQLDMKLAHMRRFINRGKADKTEQIIRENAAINSRALGVIEWIEENQVKKFLANHNTSGIDFVVVTTKNLIEEARARFKTGQVFTADEIGGLEYPNIIVYKLTAHPFAKLLNQGLKQYHPDAADFQNLPKINTQQQDALLFLNWVHTAITRSKHAVFMIETQQSDRRLLCEFLKGFIREINAPTVTHPVTPEPITSTADSDWESHIAGLIKNNHLSQAKATWQINLRRDEKSFEAFLAQFQTIKQPNKPENNTRKPVKPAPTPKTTSSPPVFTITKKEIQEKLGRKEAFAIWTRVSKHSKTKKSLFLRVLECPEHTQKLFEVIHAHGEEYANRLADIITHSLNLAGIDEDHGGKTPFLFWLLDDAKRSQLLEEVFQCTSFNLYTNFNKRVSAKDLIQTYGSEMYQCHIPTIALMALRCPALFAQYLLRDSEILQPVLQPFWLRRFTNPKTSKNESLLAILCTSEEETTIVYASLFEKIKLTIPLGELSFSVVDDLLRTDIGAETLLYLIDAAPDPASTKINFTESTMLQDIDQLAGPKISRIAAFSRHAVLHPILQAFFMKPAENPSHLAAALQEEKDPSNVTMPLYHYTQTISGIYLLDLLFKYRKEIISLIPIQVWITPIANECGNNLLDCISEIPEGYEFLKKITEADYPELYKQIQPILDKENSHTSSSANTTTGGDSTLDETISTSELDDLPSQGSKNIRQLIHRIGHGDTTAVSEMMDSPLAGEIFRNTQHEGIALSTLILTNPPLLSVFTQTLKNSPEKIRTVFRPEDFKNSLPVGQTNIPFLQFLVLKEAVELFCILLKEYKETLFDHDPDDSIFIKTSVAEKKLSILTPLQDLLIHSCDAFELVLRYHPRLCSTYPINFWSEKPSSPDKFLQHYSLATILLIQATTENKPLPFMRFASLNDYKLLRALPLEYWFENSPTIIVNDHPCRFPMDLLLANKFVEQFLSALFTPTFSLAFKQYLKKNPKLKSELEKDVRYSVLLYVMDRQTASPSSAGLFQPAPNNTAGALAAHPTAGRARHGV